MNHFLGLYYRKCRLISKEDVTHDTKLFCLMLPPSTHLQVPVGQHVYLKLTITGKVNKGFGETISFLISSCKSVLILLGSNHLGY